jgi:hypothetical protein
MRTGILLSILLIFCTASVMCGQNANSGNIRGAVTDVTGAVVPGVTVTVLETNTGVSKTLTTNDSGIYEAVSILPGVYTLTFSKDGFGRLQKAGIELHVGTISVDAQLQLGSTQQVVEVSTEAPLLKTETGEQATSLEAETMQKLPNVSQSWTNFTKILPGASGSGTGVSVNGAMKYEANFLSDGGSITYPQSANVDTGIFETISEVQISTSSFDAQYGIGGVVMNQITKSGTNQYHGAAYEYLQNDFMNARSFFAAGVQNLRYDNYGVAVGGPIKKDKMFFFFDYDKLHDASTSFPYNTFPTTDMRNGNFSSTAFPAIYDPRSNMTGGARTLFAGNQIPVSQLDPVALKLQAYFPNPNIAGAVNNDWLGAEPANTPSTKYFGRLDYNISSNNRLSGSITERDSPSFTLNPECPVNCYHGDVDGIQAQITDVWTISPNLINEFRFSVARQGNWFTPETLNGGYPQKLGINYAQADIFPSVTIGGPIGATSIGPGTAAQLMETSFEPSDVVTMIKGKHVLKFGAEVLALQSNKTSWGNIQSASLTFNPIFTAQQPGGSGGLGYADFLLGDVQSWSVNNVPIVGMRMKSPQFFIQDDYKILPNLTLNLGLRYQIQGGWSEVAGRVGLFDPTITNPVTNTPGAVWFQGDNGRNTVEKPIYDTFLPRVGFAYTLHKDWVFRGGFGMYTYLWSGDTYATNGVAFGSGSTGSLTNTDRINPVFQLSNPNPPLNIVPGGKSSMQPGAFNGQNLYYYPYNTPLAKSYQWNFSVQRQLPFQLVAQAAYVGNHGTNLSYPVDLNQVPTNLLGVGNAQANRPYPQFLSIDGDNYNAISNYDSLQLQLQKRTSHGLSFDINYTWSKMLDDMDSSGWGGQTGAQYYQIATDPRLNYGLSNYNVAKMFKGDLTYQLPFGKGRTFLKSNSIADVFVGGWQLATIFTFESGMPFTPVMGTANLTQSLAASGGNFGNAAWYPNVVGNPNVANPTVQQWFNPLAFAQPSPYTYGNAGRNILIGPGLADVDLSLAKSFKIPKLEHGGLQLRFDATNIANHPSFMPPGYTSATAVGAPGNMIGSAGAGTITSTTTTNNGRVLQLGARFSF